MEPSATTGLESQLAELAAGAAADVSYAFVPTDGASGIRWNSDRCKPAVSAAKTYILAALYAADAAGRLSLDRRVEYGEAHHILGTGVLKLMTPGLRPTLRDCARLMMVFSDNVAANIVIEALGGPQATNAAIHALGLRLPATEVRDYVRATSWDPEAFAVSSADDFTTVLSALHRGECTGSPTHDAEVCWTLRRLQWRYSLGRYLPCSEHAEEFGLDDPTRCGSRTGVLPGVFVDAGIVETAARVWTVAVQIQGDPDSLIGLDHPYPLLVATMSKLVFDAWSIAGSSGRSDACG